MSKKGVKPLIIFTPNPEIINFAQKNQNFKEIVNSAQIYLPDGAGVVWALKKLHKMEIPKITGVDFVETLASWASGNAVAIGLIGGKEGVADRALECLRKKNPHLKGWSMELPNFEIPNLKSQIPDKFPISTGKILQTEKYFSTITKQIIKKKIGIIFVALGFPKQEIFIRQLSNEAMRQSFSLPLVLMSVGGAFDYISGRVLRAPLWMRERGLEWLYRLIREPWRLGRQIEGGKFFWKILFKYP